jgi:hypothetical protein
MRQMDESGPKSCSALSIICNMALSSRFSSLSLYSVKVISGQVIIWLDDSLEE